MNPERPLHPRHALMSTLGAAALLLAGCAADPPTSYELPAIPVPAHFQQAEPTLASLAGLEGAPPAGAPDGHDDRHLAGPDGSARAPAGRGAGHGEGGGAEATGLDPAPGPWWKDFASGELDALIDRGLANNQDSRVALQHLVQAKARADQAHAGRLPTVTAPVLIGDQSGGSTSVGAAPTGSATTGANAPGSQRTFQGSIRADWRLDIWGEQSALADSARFTLQRTVYERENVERNLIAAIAASYVDYLSLNDRRRLAQKTDQVMSATLATIEGRVAAGDATLSELEQQKAAIFSIRATLPTLEQQRVEIIANIAFLVGTVPGNLKLSDLGLDSLHTPRVMPGLPSELLLRRPDVRMAEAQLRGADADVAVARARLLPPMDLAAQIGRSGISPAQLLMPQSLFWSLVDNLTVTLFDSDRRKNDEVFSHSVHEEMVENYVRSIHVAMREVETALSALRLTRKRLNAEQDTLDAAHRAWDINTHSYKVGGADYLTLLDTQRNYHRYLDEFEQARVLHLHSYINLLQALGGRAHPLVEHAEARAGAAELRGGELPEECIEGLPVSAGGVRAGAVSAWQVELGGLYHCGNLGAAWRDLQSRHAPRMRGLSLQPLLRGRIDNPQDGEQSWYRLQIASFATHEEAENFCHALEADQLRCRVLVGNSRHALPDAPDGGLRPDAGRMLAANDRGDRLSDAGEDSGETLLEGGGQAEVESHGLARKGYAAMSLDARDMHALDVPTRDGGQGDLADDAGRPDGDAVQGTAVNTRKRPAQTGARASQGRPQRYLQLGVFHDEDRARALVARLQGGYAGSGRPVSLSHEGELYRVLSGPFADEAARRRAGRLARELLDAPVMEVAR